MSELKKRAIVIDADALSFLQTHPDSLKYFIIVAKSWNAVICWRVSPSQKADVVRLIKSDDPLNITLAIGDGANDVSMILEADIGIGIFGKEGVRAAQSADYAIHKFKYLWQLVLFHGRLNYIRNAELIWYFFYKNIIFTIPQFFFWFVWDYSGQSIFEDYYITFYNLFFTALPIIVKALVEMDINYKMYKDVDKRKEIKNLYPYLYYVGQRSLIFNFKNYAIWVLSGIFQSLFAFLIIHYSFQYIILSSDGYTSDIWLESIVMFTWIILIANERIMVTSRWFNWMNFLCIFVLSILLYYSYTWVSNYLSYSKTYVTSVVMHQSPIFYLNVLFSVGTCFILDMFVETIKVNLLGRPSAYVRKLVANKGEIIYDRQIQFQKLLFKYEKKFVEEDLKREHYIKRKREVRMEKLKVTLEAQNQKGIQ